MKTIKTIFAAVLISFLLTSCGVGLRGACSGNKTMAFYGGYSRKAFNK